MEKKRVYIDMDNVLVDFQSGLDKIPEDIKQKYYKRADEIPGIFALMEPKAGALKAVERLNDKFDLYILSTAPWLNPSAWSDKLLWVQKYFGEGEDNPFYKRLIISHNKHLNDGDFLIDDRDKNGAKDFKGEWIHFGSEKFPDWKTVTDYLLKE